MILSSVGHRLADALHFHQAFRLGADDFREGSEAGQQLLGQHLGIARRMAGYKTISSNS
jgi:hypothetical protein